MRHEYRLALVTFLLGILIGALIAWSFYPLSRQARLEQLAARIEAASDLVDAEVVREMPDGDLVYVSMKKAAPKDEYRPVARIEIGCDGEILPSLWDAGATYYTHHQNQPMDEDEMIAKVSDIAQDYPGI